MKITSGRPARTTGVRFLSTVLIGAMLGSGALGVPARADSGWWNTSTGTWSDTANWWTTVAGPATVAAVPTTGQTATFNGTGVNGDQIIYLGGNQAAGALVFANTGLTTLLGGVAATPASNTLTLGGSGITVNAGAGAVTIGSSAAAAPIALGTNQTWTNNSSSLMTIASPISGGSTLTIAGPGGVLLRGASTYTQNTTLSGLVRVGVSSVGTTMSYTSGPFGAGSSANTSIGRLVFAGGAITSDGSTPRSILNFLAFTGNGTFGDLSYRGKLTFGNNGTLGTSVRTLTVNSEVEFTGDLGGTGGITKQGPSLLTMSGSSSYTGATTVGAGILALGNGGNLAATAVTVNNGGIFAIRQNANSTTNAIGNATFTLAAGSFLDMADGFTSTLNLGGIAVLAPASGTRPVMTFTLAGASSDTINVTGTATAGAAGVTIAFASPTTALTPGNRTLITGGTGSALSTNVSLASSFLAGSQGLYALSLSPSSGTAAIVSVADDPNGLYWTGAGSGAWNSAGNWNTAASGGSASGSAPASANNIAFATSSPTPGNLSTSLGANTTVNSVNFLAGAGAVTVAAGNTLTINGGGITNFSANNQSINAPVTLGANQTWSNQGTGLLTIAGAVSNTTRNLTVTGPGNVAITGGLGTGSGTLTKTGTGTLTLSGLSATAAGNYSGVTLIQNGTLALQGTGPSFTGGLTFGSQASGDVGRLDLTNASAVFAGNLAASSNNSVTDNLILLGAGRALTTTGEVRIGADVHTLFTRLTVTGADGTWTVSRANGQFLLGIATSTNVGDGAFLDLSGLGTFTANLGTTNGLFRVGMSGNGSGLASTALLAATSSITANAVDVGGVGAGGLHRLALGSGSQTINANNLFIGGNNAAGTSNNRSNAEIGFRTATGNLTIRSSSDPVNGSANLYMGNNASTTIGTLTTTFDVAGHVADMKFGDLVMASRNGNQAQAQQASFAFDTGVLSVANEAILANSTGSSVSSNSAFMNLGGGTVGNGTATFTNGLSLARNAGTNATARTSAATLTIQANAGYSFAVTSGTITMGSLAGSTNASNQSNATINVLGGSLTMTGGIVAGGTGSGIASRALNVNGGSLNMQGNAIGSASGLITANFLSGTVQNLGELNGGGAFTKSSAGTLVLDGVNTFSGTTQVSAGMLRVASGGSINGTSGVVLDGAGAEFRYDSATPLTQPLTLTRGTLSGIGTIGTGITIGTNTILAPGNSPGTLTASAGATWSPEGTYEWEINSLAGTAGTNWDRLNVTAGGLNLGGLSAGNQFILDLATLTSGNARGPLDVPYVAGSSYEFLLASYNTLSVPGSFSTAPGSDLTALFDIRLSNWQGTQPALSDMSVLVNSTGNGISLVIVPEPAGWILGLVALGSLAVARRRSARPN